MKNEMGTDQKFDAVVVGGGPAGLYAAIQLRSQGARVAIVEEGQLLGGQYYKRRHPVIQAQYGDVRPLGTKLVAAALASGATVFSGHLLWAVNGGGELELHNWVQNKIERIRAEYILVATGAREEVVPFEGWDLPGVITPGYAMHLTAVDRTPPKGPLALVGNGVFLLPVACELVESGIEVKGIYYEGRPFRLSWKSLYAASYPPIIMELIRYLWILKRHGVKIRSQRRVLQVSGEPTVSSVEIIDDRGHTEHLSIGTLVAAHRFRPNTEVLQLLNVQFQVGPHGFDVPVVNSAGQTTNKRVFAVGETAGIAGRHAARARGELAALSVLEAAGIGKADPRRKRRLERQVIKFAKLAEANNAAFPGQADEYQSVPDSALVCRCESVTAGEVREAARLGWNDRDSVKGATRAGMGLCQGRECSVAVTCLVAQITGEDLRGQPARIPLKPVSIGALLNRFEQDGGTA